MMEYDTVRQNTRDVFFGFIKLSTFVNFHPEPGGLFSGWHTPVNHGVGYFEKKGVCEKFLELSFDHS